MERPASVEEIMEITNQPAVAINDHGVFTWINDAFTKDYGWTAEDLMDKPVTNIMPSEFRDAHNVGFSRFLATEKATVAGKPLPLAVLFKDGKIANAEHFILGEKKDGVWRFAATITLR